MVILDTVPPQKTAPSNETQLTMPFWQNGDPNLGMIGIFPFSLTGTSLQRALKHIRLSKNQAASITVALTSTDVTFRAQTRKDSYSVVASVSLTHGPQFSLPVYFQVSARLIDLEKFVSGHLEFVYDRTRSLLHLKYGSTHMRFMAESAAPFSTTVGSPIGYLHREAASALSYAGNFISRRSPDPIPVSVSIKNGMATGGYLYALSRYQSTAFDAALDIELPKQNFRNIVDAIRSLDQRLDVFASENGYSLRSIDKRVTVSWHTEPVHRFDTTKRWPSLASIATQTSQLGLWLHFLSTSIDQVNVEVRNHNNALTLHMTGIHQGLTWVCPVPATAIDGHPPVPPEAWNFSIRAKDLLDAVSANASGMTQITFVDRGLIVEPYPGNQDIMTLIFGFDRV